MLKHVKCNIKETCEPTLGHIARNVPTLQPHPKGRLFFQAVASKYNFISFFLYPRYKQNLSCHKTFKPCFETRPLDSPVDIPSICFSVGTLSIPNGFFCVFKRATLLIFPLRISVGLQAHDRKVHSRPVLEQIKLKITRLTLNV